MQERYYGAQHQQGSHAAKLRNGEDVLDELAPFHPVAVEDRDENNDHDGQQLRSR